MATQLHYGNIIYLKLVNGDRLWLSGGRGSGNELMVTRDGEDRTVESNYKWSVRETHDDAAPGNRVVNYGDYAAWRRSSGAT